MANGHGRRTTDASKLSFPLQLVILIVTTAVTAALSVWGSQAGLRSDVRDIRTRMEAKVTSDAEANALKEKLQAEQAQRSAEQAAALKLSIDSLFREIRMTQENVQNMREAVAKLEQRK